MLKMALLIYINVKNNFHLALALQLQHFSGLPIKNWHVRYFYISVELFFFWKGIPYGIPSSTFQIYVIGFESHLYQS